MKNVKTIEAIHKKTHRELLKKQNKNRITYIDIARGIAIILMIAGHVCHTGWKRDIIFSFHMPLFIIVSGMFFKEEKFKDILKNTIIKLLIPYFVTIIITSLARFLFLHQTLTLGQVFGQIILAHSNYRTFFKEFGTVGVLWFIPFLALSKLLFYTINKISKDDDWLKGIMCLLISTIGLYMTKRRIFLPWSFDIVLASIIFYYVGYILKKYNLLDKILKNYKILILITLLWLLGLKLGTIELAVRLYPYGLTCYITAICGTLICFFISTIIEKYLKYLTNILKWFGKNTLYILCFHYLESSLLNYHQLGINEKWQIFAAKLVIITVLTYILTKSSYLIDKLRLKIKEHKNEK